MKLHYGALAVAALLLAACADTHKDYDAQANCQNLGYSPGTKEYDNCVSEEKMVKLMEQQHQEYEEMKQQQEDWNMRRY